MKYSSFFENYSLTAYKPETKNAFFEVDEYSYFFEWVLIGTF